jgi:hypothetical protein
MYRKLSLEREVDQMVNDMMQKEGWTRSYALSILRSKFESEERYQEVSYVDDLIRKEAGEQEKEQEFEPTATTTTTTNTVAEEVITTREPEVTTSSRKPSKVTRPLQQKELHETISSKSISKQLDKQTIQINKKITQIIQPLQKQSRLIRQLQSQLKQLQKQVSQIQRVVGMGKKKQKR